MHVLVYNLANSDNLTTSEHHPGTFSSINFLIDFGVPPCQGEPSYGLPSVVMWTSVPFNTSLAGANIYWGARGGQGGG